MAEMLVPGDGARGIDIERPDGSKIKIDADKAGRVSVDDPKLIRALKAEGFTVAGRAAMFNVRSSGWNKIVGRITWIDLFAVEFLPVIPNQSVRYGEEESITE